MFHVYLKGKYLMVLFDSNKHVGWFFFFWDLFKLANSFLLQILNSLTKDNYWKLSNECIEVEFWWYYLVISSYSPFSPFVYCVQDRLQRVNTIQPSTYASLLKFLFLYFHSYCLTVQPVTKFLKNPVTAIIPACGTTQRHIVRDLCRDSWGELVYNIKN